MRKLFLFIAFAALVTACGGPSKPSIPVDGEYIVGDSAKGVKYINKNGIVVSEMPYVNNRAEGLTKEYFDDGKLRLSVAFVDAKRHGMLTTYFDTGEKHSETPYVKGKVDGVKRMFKKDGTVIMEAECKNGRVLPGIKEYDAEGKLLPQPTLKLKPKGGVLELSLEGPFNSVKYFQLKDDVLTPITTSGTTAKLESPERGTIIYAEYITSRGEKAGLEAKY